MTGKPVGTPMAHRGTVHCAAFSPDGKAVLTGTNDTPLPRGVLGGGGGGEARLWDAATGKPIGPPIVHQGVVTWTAFSPDGKAFLHQHQPGGTAVGYGHPEAYRGPNPNRGPNPIRATCRPLAISPFSPDGKTVLIASATTARLWSAETGRALIPPIRHQSNVGVVAFSPDGKTILTGTSTTDGQVRLWDAATGEPLASSPMTHKGIVRSVAFSPDSRTFLTGSDDGKVRLWDAAIGKPITAPMIGHLVVATAFRPDGRACWTRSSDGMTLLWPVPSPLVDDAKRITLWIQLITDMQLDNHGEPTHLSRADRGERLQRLEDLGGAPLRP